MATLEVTGIPESEIDNFRDKHYVGSPHSNHYDFQELFCFAKIPRQPEDYSGPDRYCTQRAERFGRCRFHGSRSTPRPWNLDKYAALKHSMFAKRGTIMDTLDSGEREGEVNLYNWITKDWPRAYGIDIEEDPVAEYEFHALALEIIRAERAEGWILAEGEKNEKKVFSPEGHEYEEDVEHYLSEMISRQRKLIMKMEDNLGISRKQRIKQDNQSDATEAVKGLAEIGKAVLDKEEHEYNAEEFD